MTSGLRSGGRKRAFTMVELMGATTIAIFLIIILYNLFDKVQSVFVVGQSRALAMEDGRIAMDLVAEDFLLLESGWEVKDQTSYGMKQTAFWEFLPIGNFI